MSNTFYKPKNELGQLLASESFVSNEINKLDDKLSNIIGDLEHEITGGVNQITGRPSINVEIISHGTSIEEYLRLLWQNCKNEEERITLKTKIGRTLYLRPALPDASSGYEEYICINPADIRVENTIFGSDIIFDRLGSAEASLATSKRAGSVKLVPSLYDISSDEWASYSFAETIAGVPTGKYLPVDGVGVAPMALRAFVNKIKDTEAKVTNAEQWIDRTSSWISETDTKISDILDILNDDENNTDPSSRLNIIESDITNIENIIGINGCCAICGEKGCSCNCEGDTNSLDCSIICKINSLEEGLTDNSDQIASLGSDVNQILNDINEINNNINSSDELINNTINSINELESIIGIKDSSLIADTIWGQIKQENIASTTLNNIINDIKTEIGTSSNAADHDGTLYSRIKQNKADIATINTIIGTSTSNGNAEGSIYERIKQNKIDIDTISNTISSLNDKIGTASDETNPNGTLYQRVKQNKVDIETLSNVIGPVSDLKNTISLHERVEENKSNIAVLSNKNSEATAKINALENRSKFNTILLSCEIPAEDFNTEETEAIIEISYSKIAEAITASTGEIIAPSNLTIIFNSARFTSSDNTLAIEHFYPDVTYKGFDDLENISRRSLVLKFAGYNEARYALISLSYYDNSLITPYKIN